MAAVLRDLLTVAENNGGLTGFVFVAKFDHGHQAGVAGAYREHPELALPAAVRLQRQIVSMIGECE